MISTIAQTIVTLSALFLVGLSVSSFLLPGFTAGFLQKFASSARAHFLEIGIRSVVGAALVAAAPSMRYSAAFSIFGWVIVVTSVVLLLLPWRWHREFADWVVPPLSRRVWVVGLFAFPLGAIMLYAALSQWTS